MKSGPIAFRRRELKNRKGNNEAFTYVCKYEDTQGKCSDGWIGNIQGMGYLRKAWCYHAFVKQSA
jgi:hypothetical protein